MLIFRNLTFELWTRKDHQVVIFGCWIRIWSRFLFVDIFSLERQQVYSEHLITGHSVELSTLSYTEMGKCQYSDALDKHNQIIEAVQNERNTEEVNVKDAKESDKNVRLNYQFGQSFVWLKNQLARLQRYYLVLMAKSLIQ